MFCIVAIAIALIAGATFVVDDVAAAAVAKNIGNYTQTIFENLLEFFQSLSFFLEFF